MNTIEQHSSHLFVFAHPDDEVYSCGLMHQLINDGKAVTAVFITSGDAGVNPETREVEVMESMAAIGLRREAVVLLGFSESEVLGNFPKISESLKDAAAMVNPDCVVGMDYEGGHEVHDSASFLTSRAAADLAVSHYVFPVYHAKNGVREAALFASGHSQTDMIELSPEDVGVKIKVLEAHRGQIGHFLHLQRQSPEYFKRLFSREIFRKITSPIDYSQRPDEVGYERHRNGFKFADFKRAVEALGLKQ